MPWLPAASSPSCDHSLLSRETRISCRGQSLHHRRASRRQRALVFAEARTQDQAADANLGSSTRLRVERQTHLPLTREEAWRSLRMLAPSEDWKHLLKVFTALESVYREEAALMGESLLKAYRTAQDTREPSEPETATKLDSELQDPSQNEASSSSSTTSLQDAASNSNSPVSSSKLRGDDSRQNGKSGRSAGSNSNATSSEVQNPTRDQDGASTAADENSAYGLRQSSGTLAQSGSASGPGNGKQGLRGPSNAQLEAQQSAWKALQTGENPGSSHQGQPAYTSGSLNQQTMDMTSTDSSSRDTQLLERKNEDGPSESASDMSKHNLGNGAGSSSSSSGLRAGDGRAASNQDVQNGHTAGSMASSDDAQHSNGKAAPGQGPAEDSSSTTSSSSSGQPHDRSGEAEVGTAAPQSSQTDEGYTLTPMASVDHDAAARMGAESVQQAAAGEVPHGWTEPEAADYMFLTLLLQALLKAHFVRLTRRDVEMARSLNSDYLAQLFIRADTSKMDRQLVEGLLDGADLPEEAKALLVFKRGYGQQKQEGRLLVAKLDFLQALVVQAILSRASSWIPNTWHRFTSQIRSIRQSVGRAAKEQGAADVPEISQEQLDRLSSGLNSAVGALEDSVGYDPAKDEREQRQQADRRRGGPGTSSNKDDKEELPLSDELPVRRTARRIAKWVEGSGVVGLPLIRLTYAGGGLAMTLANWGLLPINDVLPLAEYDRSQKPKEPSRLQPVYVRRVSIRDALQGQGGLINGGLKAFFSSVKLAEPTFRELLVVYREAEPPNRVAELKKRLPKLPNFQASEDDKKQELSPEKPKLRKRGKIVMRAYRDIPVPSWKVIFPDKLLQFRPLDGLRSDLITLSGLVSLALQSRYDSIILEIVTFASAAAFFVRVFLGYKRMNDRYEKMSQDMLAETSLAGQDAVISFLASSASLQQFAQTAVAFLLMQTLKPPRTADTLSSRAEELLETEFQIKMRFNADEALGELDRLGMLQPSDQEKVTEWPYDTVAPDQAFDRLHEHWESLFMDRLKQAEEIA